MLVAQIPAMHILAEGKVFHSPRPTIPADDPTWSHIDTAACLARAVAQLNALTPMPDVTVITGDLTNYGAADEYAHLRTLLASLRMPHFLIPGNHDDREKLRGAFADHLYLPRRGFLHYTVEDYPLRIVALDTNIPGDHGGELCAERLAWLDDTLKSAPVKPTLVLMHHPPFATGIEHMDRYALRDPAALAETPDAVPSEPKA